jgi:hypothetical protein
MKIQVLWRRGVLYHRSKCLNHQALDTQLNAHSCTSKDIDRYGSKLVIYDRCK